MNRLCTTLWTTLLLVLLTASLAPAQPHMGNDSMREERLRQRITMTRIWKLTEFLNLDEETAAVFFPRYQRYVSEQDTLTQQLRRVDAAMGDAVESGEGEFESLLDKSIELEEALVRTRIDFVRKSGEVLDQREQVALMLFERRFQQRLRDMVFDLQREMGPPGGGPHGRGRGPRGEGP